MAPASRGLLLGLVAVALATPAGANDTLVTLAAGGLVPRKSSAIAMVSEDLQVSVRQIRVKYVFRNDSDQDIDAIVAFPMPVLDGAGIANSPVKFPAASPLNFMDFRVLVAGEPVKPKIDIRAYYEGRDITARLRDLRLPLSVLDRQRLNAAVGDLTEDQQRELKKGLLVDDWPYWHTSIQYYWNQHFQAKTDLEVQHSYRPIVGGGYITKDSTLVESDERRDYCGNAETLQRIKAAQQRSTAPRNDTVLLEREVHYILTTANNWKGPIGNFHLTVTTRPEDILTTCMEGLERTGPGRYELVRSNFRPSRELKLLIVEPQEGKHRSK